MSSKQVLRISSKFFRITDFPKSSGAEITKSGSEPPLKSPQGCLESLESLLISERSPSDVNSLSDSAPGGWSHWFRLGGSLFFQWSVRGANLSQLTLPLSKKINYFFVFKFCPNFYNDPHHHDHHDYQHDHSTCKDGLLPLELPSTPSQH